MSKIKLKKKKAGKSKGPTPASKKRIKAMYTYAQGVKETGLQSDPKVFTCKHCGGYHQIELNCNCGVKNAAQDIVSTSKKDVSMAMAVCVECLALTVAIVKCNGIDPDLQYIQEQIDKSFEVIEGGKSEDIEK